MTMEGVKTDCISPTKIYPSILFVYKVQHLDSCSWPSPKSSIRSKRLRMTGTDSLGFETLFISLYVRFLSVLCDSCIRLDRFRRVLENLVSFFRLIIVFEVLRKEGSGLSTFGLLFELSFEVATPSSATEYCEMRSDLFDEVEIVRNQNQLRNNSIFEN